MTIEEVQAKDIDNIFSKIVAEDFPMREVVFQV
jgi:hypothetical protein